jgi:serine protease Do
MSRRFTIVTVLLTGTVAFLVGTIVAGGLAHSSLEAGPALRGLTARADSARQRGPMIVSGPVSFADVVERINPAVVNIEATAPASALRHRIPRTLREPSDPVDRPARRRSDAPQRGAGSGFIIDADGSILTNHHLVDGAERIVVKLSDGRSLRARIVGTDPDTDIALVKVDGQQGLPVAPLGDSSSLRMGEWVCAIGNPLGYEHTVTVGVVSFVGRKLFDASLDDYIQTDAAINFGNSGGPLINARGEVVGINAAVSPRASNIGFAVPIAGATAILSELRARGRVSRGDLGLAVRDVDADVQEALGLPVSRGALVQDVTPGSPADRAGLRPYDLVRSFDGVPVTGEDQLVRAVASAEPGVAAVLQLFRDGRPLTITVKLAERPSRRDAAPPMAETAPTVDSPEERLLGLTVRELDAATFNRYALPGTTRGLLITRIDELGPAADVDVPRGSILLEVARRPVTTLAAYRRVVADLHRGDVVALYVYLPDVGQRQLKTIRLDATSR